MIYNPGGVRGIIPRPSKRVKVIYCPPGFDEYCVNDDGTACPYYHEGHCVKASNEEMER